MREAAERELGEAEAPRADGEREALYLVADLVWQKAAHEVLVMVKRNRAPETQKAKCRRSDTYCDRE